MTALQQVAIGAEGHRRKSSECCFMVTNEGQRKAIRDFNVHEMKMGKKTSTHKFYQKVQNNHQTKRMAAPS